MLDNKVIKAGTLLILNGKIYIDGWDLEKPGMCREHCIFACLHSAELLMKAAAMDIAAPGAESNTAADMPNETPLEWLCSDTREFHELCREIEAAKPAERTCAWKTCVIPGGQIVHARQCTTAGLVWPTMGHPEYCPDCHGKVTTWP